MKPEQIRRFENFIWTLLPRAAVAMLFVGGQGWVGYLIWQRLFVARPNVGDFAFAVLFVPNVVLCVWLAYYYRSMALVLTAVGWLIVSGASLLFAVGFDVPALLTAAACLHLVLLILGLGYLRVFGIDPMQLEKTGRESGQFRETSKQGKAQ